MFPTAKYSYLSLRLALAIVFFWLGIDKMLNPQHWLGVLTPVWLANLTDRFGLGSSQLIYANAVFEILVGLSLITAVFAKFFSVLAVVFLATVLIVNEFAIIMIRDIGLIGGFLAIIFWPNIRSRF